MSDKGNNVNKVAIIPEQIFNGLVEYMLSKPYSEVAQVIDALKANVQIMDEPTVTVNNTEVEETNDDI